jgi:hypothetical protein
MTTALEGGKRSASRPGRSLPPAKTRYLLYRRLGGHQGRSGQVWKILPPPGFDPLTVQPVASRYTDYATRPILPKSACKYFLCLLLTKQYFNCNTLFLTHVHDRRHFQRMLHRLRTVMKIITDIRANKIFMNIQNSKALE